MDWGFLKLIRHASTATSLLFSSEKERQLMDRLAECYERNRPVKRAMDLP